MERSSREIRVDRVLLEGVRDPSGRWILGANVCVAALYIVSPWALGEVLVAFWLEAVVVAAIFAVLVALASRSGPTRLHRIGRVGVWLVLAGGFLVLTGAAVSWTMAMEGAVGGTIAGTPAGVIPPILPVLGATPGIALGWILLRSLATFSDVFVERRFEHGLGLAASRFFVVYLPVLAAITGLFALTGGRYARLVPFGFLAVLTYFELVLTLKLLPLLDEA